MSNKLELVKRLSPKTPRNWDYPAGKAAVERGRDAEELDDRRAALSTQDRYLAEKIEMLTLYAGGRKAAAMSMGVSVSTLDNYRSGQTQPRFFELLKLADAANHPVEYLLLGTDFENLVKTDADDDGLVVLPLYDQRASAGAGALVQSKMTTEDFKVGREWLRRNLPAWAPSNAVVGVLEGGGDSMEPTIRDGDLVMVVQDVDWRIVERGGVFVLSVDDRLLLKRLEVLVDGDLSIISDNKAYAEQRIPLDDIQHRVIVHGQVFFCGGKPRSF